MPPNDCDRLVQNVDALRPLVEHGELAPHVSNTKTVRASLGIHGSRLSPARDPLPRGFGDPALNPPRERGNRSSSVHARRSAQRDCGPL
jgi:hypothetical protein